MIVDINHDHLSYPIRVNVTMTHSFWMSEDELVPAKYTNIVAQEPRPLFEDDPLGSAILEEISGMRTITKLELDELTRTFMRFGNEKYSYTYAKFMLESGLWYFGVKIEN